MIQKTFSRKGRPHRALDTPLQPVPSQTNVKDATRQLQPAFIASRGLKQTHLDLGQAGFHCHTCALCGMTYAPGEEADEELHAAHHAKLVQGVRFHGWQNERVLHRDGLSGYVLLVLPTDPVPHVKKVKEVAQMLEDQLGLVHGWLMSVPCKVYLYVSASKRVVGCVLLQAIQSACPAIPAEDTAASTGDSAACEPSSRAPLGAQLQPTGRPVAAWLPDRSSANLQPRRGLFPSAGIAVSNTQECSDTVAVRRSVFSDPAGLQPQSRGHSQALTPVGFASGAARNGNPAPSGTPELCHTAPEKSRKRSWAPSGVLASKRASLGNPCAAERHSKAQLQRQQGILKGWLGSAKKPPPKQEAAQGDCSMAAPQSPTASCCSGATRASTGLVCAASVHREVLAEKDFNQQSASSQDRAPQGVTSASHAPLQRQPADVNVQHGGCRHSTSVPCSQAETEDDSMGRKHMMDGQGNMLGQQESGRQPGRAQMQRSVDFRGQGRAPLLVDESRRVPAVCGVRVVWVSADVRRQGIASKLLDLARCHVLAGYVVPRHELAFSQPTELGRSFAIAYTGLHRLLVYQ